MTDPPAEELERESAYLKRVARRLVHDEATADDLVQDVWLESLGRSLDPARRLHWLHRTLEFAALNWHRSARHRSDRETRAAEGRSSEALDDEIERRSTREWLSRAIEELGEPSAETLRLLYFEELTIAKAAVRLGCPEGTVKARLHRGLQRLRLRLQSRFEDGRALGVGLIAAFDWEPEDLPQHLRVLTRATAVGIGTTLVPNIPWLGALAVALSVLWLVGREGTTHRRAADVADNSAGGRPTTTTEADQVTLAASDQAQESERQNVSSDTMLAVQPSEAEAASPGADSALTLDIIVTDRGGAPVPEIEIYLVSHVGGGVESMMPTGSKTDEEGRLLLRLKSEDIQPSDQVVGSPGFVTVGALDRQWAGSDLYTIWWRPGEVHKLEIVLPGLALTIRGQVLDADGEPLKGALVRTNGEKSARSDHAELSRWPVVAACDSGGEFVLESLRQGIHLLTAKHPGFLPTSVTVDGRISREETATVRMQRANSVITGTARDLEGRPVPGASVGWARNRMEKGVGQPTDGEGRFELSGLRSGPYRIWAELAGESEVVSVQAEPGQTVEIDLQLSDAHALHVLPVRAGGADPRSMQVLLSTMDLEWTETLRDFDELGCASSNRCPDEAIRILVFDERFGLPVGHLVTDGPDPNLVQVPCRVPERTARVTGTIALPPNSAAALQSIILTFVPSLVRVQSNVDLDGRFEFRELFAGEYLLQLAEDGLGRLHLGSFVVDEAVDQDLGVFEVPPYGWIEVNWSWPLGSQESSAEWILYRESVAADGRELTKRLAVGKGPPPKRHRVFPGVVGLRLGDVGSRFIRRAKVHPGRTVVLEAKPDAGVHVALRAEGTSATVQFELWSLEQSSVIEGDLLELALELKDTREPDWFMDEAAVSGIAYANPLLAPGPWIILATTAAGEQGVDQVLIDDAKGLYEVQIRY